MIHHTVGVYNDGSRKENGVSSENIASHIWYNLGMRPVALYSLTVSASTKVI